MTIFRDQPNDLGWYIEDKVEARGALLDSSSNLIHGACYSGERINVGRDNFNLRTIKDASTNFLRRSSLLNQYTIGEDNWFIT